MYILIQLKETELNSYNQDDSGYLTLYNVIYTMQNKKKMLPDIYMWQECKKLYIDLHDFESN